MDRPCTGRHIPVILESPSPQGGTQEANLGCETHSTWAYSSARLSRTFSMRSWRLSRPSLESLSDARFQVSKPCHASPCPNKMRTKLIKAVTTLCYRHKWWLCVAAFNGGGIENIFTLSRPWWVEAVVTQITITSRLRDPMWRTGLILGYLFHRCGEEQVQAATEQRTTMIPMRKP